MATAAGAVTPGSILAVRTLEQRRLCLPSVWAAIPLRSAPLLPSLTSHSQLTQTHPNIRTHTHTFPSEELSLSHLRRPRSNMAEEVIGRRLKSVRDSSYTAGRNKEPFIPRKEFYRLAFQKIQHSAKETYGKINISINCKTM